MICPKCSNTAADSQSFCGNCGHRFEPATIDALSARLASLEAKLATSLTDAKKSEQNFLEVETSERIVSRLMKWTQMFFYWVGIPCAFVLVLLGLLVGKEELNLRSMVTTARDSVKGTVTQAKEELSKAEQTANDALNVSKQVSSETIAAKNKVAELKSQLESRSRELQTLDAQIKTAQSRIETQTQQVQRISEQLHVVATAKAEAQLHSAYPVFGRHVAGSTDGWIDPSTKSSGNKWVDVNLSLSTGDVLSGLSDTKLVEAIESVKSKNYRVFLGPVSTYARTANTSQPIGMGLDANSCMYWPDPKLKEPPCVLYFNEAQRNAAIEVRDLLSRIERIPTERIVFVNPKGLDAQRQELLTLSGIDILVVLTRANPQTSSN